jgi:tripartite-type tricarboxylate transporter receptor subunit TctC
MRTTARVHTMFLSMAILSGSVLMPNPARADTYPSQPIRLIVPIAPGGAPDVLARTIAEKLGPLLGQTIFTVNRPGANGTIGMEVLANSPPDGYTLAIAYDSLLAINPHLYKRKHVNTPKDFTPVAMVAASSAFLFVVPTSMPVKTFPEFIAYAKKANPPLAYASGGSGSLHHLGMEMLKQRAGINMVHVPYKGGAPEVTAAISGEVSAALTSSVSSTFVRAGKLRALAVTGAHRLPSLPDVPTVSEFYPGLEVSSWFGIFGPAGLPEPVLEKLRANIALVLAMPEVRKRFQAAGEFVPFVMTPKQFTDRIDSDYDKFGKLVDQIGIQVD